MKAIENVDEHINNYALMFLVMTNTLGVLILYLPRLVASKTVSADGAIGIMLGGFFACVFGWFVAKLVSKFPGQSFLSFTEDMLTKPVAIFISLLFALQYVTTASYNARLLSEVSRQYLFDQTPIEIICLAFLLVVIYAVSGLRVGIFRLNFLFLPILIVVSALILLLTLGSFEKRNILPLLQTDFKGYLHATMVSFQAFIGFGIVLFYISLVDQPQKTPKMTVLGILCAVLIFLITFIVCIGVFGNITTINIIFPNLEIAKSIQIPGGFMESFDLVVFSVWILTVFITCLIAFDISVHIFQLLLPNKKKIHIVLMFSPIIYFLSMIPKDYLELLEMGHFFNYFIPTYLFLVFILLSVAYKKKGLKQVD